MPMRCTPLRPRKGRRPGLSELIEVYRKLLLARGRVKQHAEETAVRIKTMLKLMDASHHRDVTPTAIELALGTLRNTLSPATCNRHLASLRSFWRWGMIAAGIGTNPLISIRPFNEKLDRRHPRRALTESEILTLIERTREGLFRRGMMGGERAMLYLTALYTGFRSNELRSLQAGDLEPAAIILKAEAAKNRHAVRQLIPGWLANQLRAHLCERSPSAPMFRLPEPSGVVRMFRADLRAAGILYVTRDGFADFHALRHTYVTRASRVCDAKTAQVLARHSTITLTMDVYAHRDAADLVAAVELMPRICPAFSSPVGAEGFEPSKAKAIRFTVCAPPELTAFIPPLNHRPKKPATKPRVKPAAAGARKHKKARRR